MHQIRTVVSCEQDSKSLLSGLHCNRVIALVCPENRCRMVYLVASQMNTEPFLQADARYTPFGE